LQAVADLLSRDREANPSRYSIVVVSEGATPVGSDVFESGEADAFGHRKLGGIGQYLGEGLKRLTGTNVMVQSLGYLLRSGAPDATDLLVPKNYGTLAVRLIEEGKTGVMVAVKDGKYVTQPADISTKGQRRVEVGAMYDPASYKPLIANLLGAPIYLQ